VTANGTPDLFLLGWTGDYNDAGNFVGSFFGRAKPDFGLTADNDGKSIFAEVSQADGTVDPAGHASAYEQVNRDLMQKYLPAVPLSSSPPALVVRNNISGIVPSPLTDERYASVTKG
jgi:peptide/nickel transport system substrate-binding protein